MIWPPPYNSDHQDYYMFSRGFLLTFTFHCYREGAIPKLYVHISLHIDPWYFQTTTRNHPLISPCNFVFSPTTRLQYEGTGCGEADEMPAPGGLATKRLLPHKLCCPKTSTQEVQVDLTVIPVGWRHLYYMASSQRLFCVINAGVTPTKSFAGFLLPQWKPFIWCRLEVKLHLQLGRGPLCRSWGQQSVEKKELSFCRFGKFWGRPKKIQQKRINYQHLQWVVFKP